jgi:NAD(P)-dependent dehydrogenase (short-subunit alcohol dehydrogenase family)
MHERPWVALVNAVAPGLVDTPMTAEWTEAQHIWREHAPMSRAAQPLQNT